MEHGTVEMYRKELKSTEMTPCDECKAAQARYMADYRAVKPRNRSTERRAARIRRRATKRLTEEYADRFAELLTEESER